jgi:hypothetical protein
MSPDEAAALLQQALRHLRAVVLERRTDVVAEVTLLSPSPELRTLTCAFEDPADDDRAVEVAASVAAVKAGLFVTAEVLRRSGEPLDERPGRTGGDDLVRETAAWIEGCAGMVLDSFGA